MSDSVGEKGEVRNGGASWSKYSSRMARGAQLGQCCRGPEWFAPEEAGRATSFVVLTGCKGICEVKFPKSRPDASSEWSKFKT